MPESVTTHGADILPPPRLLERCERLRRVALTFANRHPDDQSPIAVSMLSIPCGWGRFPGIEKEAYELLDDIALFLKAYPDRDKQLSDAILNAKREERAYCNETLQRFYKAFGITRTTIEDAEVANAKS